MEWFDSFLYLVFISIIAFPIGRMIPKRWMHYDRYPFRAFAWEDGGKIYNRLNVRKWQNEVPDMSRIAAGIMKPKEIPDNSSADDIRYLLDETCVAEAVHVLECIFGMYCMALWPGVGGSVFFVLYVVLCNLPYIIIQRYNRPKLARLYRRMSREKSESDESAETVLRCRRRS